MKVVSVIRQVFGLEMHGLLATRFTEDTGSEAWASAGTDGHPAAKIWKRKRGSASAVDSHPVSWIKVDLDQGAITSVHSGNSVHRVVGQRHQTASPSITPVSSPNDRKQGRITGNA